MTVLQDSIPTKTRVCPWWRAYSFDNWLRGLVHKPAKILGPYLKPGMRAVDIGCGMGFFSLGMARLVGPSGSVTALDLQPRMLSRVAKRSGRAGLDHIIRTRRCEQHDLGLTDTADFCLGFWMAHEVPDLEKFLSQVHSMLVPGGIFFMAEPRIHVSRAKYGQERDKAVSAGFELIDEPKVGLSRAAVFKKP